MSKRKQKTARKGPVECRGRTLVEALRIQLEERPEVEHLLPLADDGTPEEPLTFAQLHEGAEAVARGLRARRVMPGETVALMLPTGRDFFFSFLGILFAGAVPVPIYPPVKLDQLEEYAGRQSGILRNAQAKALITVPGARALAGLLRPQAPTLGPILRAEQLMEEGRRWRTGIALPEVSEDDLGLIQYTSGSTGDPKGVALTHANLIANIRAIGEAVEVRGEDVVVSWLPLYHDMGLIGCWLFALCHGLPIVSFSPLAFLRRPKRWLQAMTDYRGALSPAPNFAYELCLRRIRDRDLADLDLSSWRAALNGAEPIHPDTLERFCDRFGPRGFDPRALKPVYGLAENAVALTFTPLRELPRVDRVERDAFQRHRRAVPVGEDGDGDLDATEILSFVGVGRPIPGNELRLVDDRGKPVPERVEGLVEFRGASATAGYYRNPEATAAIRTGDGWIRSGDLGYLADGDLFITGRGKDLIIKAGRNVYPQEVESVAAEVEGVRRGCVAAFGVPDPETGSEQLVVVAETRRKSPEDRQHLASEIRKRVGTEVKVAPDAVIVVGPHTIPKTPSGKLRRAETRSRHLEGTLERRRVPAWLQVTRLAAGSVWSSLRRLVS
jgi:acyl-CoA synthetase (AMP-forming)/AMP-acid ligase II